MRRILIACEKSGVVRRAFASIGFEAWSCDILPSEDNSPFHHTGPLEDFIGGGEEWWAIVGHPPCTTIANSGVAWLYNKNGRKNLPRWRQLEQGCAFFNMIRNRNCPRIAVENPIPHKYAVELLACPMEHWPNNDGRYTQIIQPWMFGHPEQKATCLWLKGLPPLQPTKNVRAEMLKLPDNKRQRLHYLPPKSGAPSYSIPNLRGDCQGDGRTMGQTVNCIFPSCDKKRYSRGLCVVHYSIARTLIKTAQTSWSILERNHKALPPSISKKDESARTRFLKAEEDYSI